MGARPVLQEARRLADRGVEAAGGGRLEIRAGRQRVDVAGQPTGSRRVLDVVSDLLSHPEVDDDRPSEGTRDRDRARLAVADERSDPLEDRFSERRHGVT
jgi:hypothetical protein